MLINNQDINIDDMYDNKYMHTINKNGIYLSEYQNEVLLRYNIDINKIGSITELIYLIDEVLDDEADADDLDAVSKEISEFNYYANTNK